MVTAAPAGYIVASPTSVNFEQALFGSLPQNIPVTITNSGDLPAIVQIPTISGSDIFSLQNLPTGATTLVPGASFYFTVRATSNAHNLQTATITVASDGANNGGTGIRTIAVQKYIIHNAITVTPLSNLIDFGHQEVGSTVAPQTITITNSGNQTLTLNSVVASNLADFPTTVIPGGNHSLAAGASYTLTVNVNTATIGSKTGSITITNSVTQNPIVIQLSAFITVKEIVVTPSYVPFGNVTVGQAATPVPMTITNAGNVELVIQNVTITGVNASEFSLTSAPAPGAVITPGNSVRLQYTILLHQKVRK
jgi:hypothetical protein